MSRLLIVAIVLVASAFGLGVLRPGNAENARDETTIQQTTQQNALQQSQAPLQAVETRQQRRFKAGQKFVEFRGELNYFPGNTSLIYGTLGPDGEPLDYQYVSYEPAGGIVGLVAGRITEEYFRPTVVMELGAVESRASCRSIPQFDITHALDQCADLLVEFALSIEADADFTPE